VDDVDVVMVGPFGMRPRGTMRARALPMAKALAARGHEVSILLPPWQNPEAAGERWREGGVRVENIPLPPGIPGLFHGATTLRLARRALAARPDVVHLFKPKAYSGLVHWLLARLPRGRRPRLVVDTDDWEGPGGWNAMGDYTALERRFFTWQERWGLSHADAVTVASRTLESLVWAMGVPPERVFYVPNGVTEAREAQRQEGESVVPTMLLYTRFFEFPISRVLDVLHLVRERVPRAQLMVVGKGLFGEEEELFRLAAAAGLEVARVAGAGEGKPRGLEDGSQDVAVRYVGWVDSERLPSIFARADVAIYPFDDTLVNRAKCAVKLGDLLAAGVPVVAEAVGQNQAYIRDGETGFLVGPGDVKAFANAVARLLESPALRRRVRRAAVEDVEERFSWGRLVETVERAYGAGV
jgi:glycosyltransferase involved in cell wall biosynthesis